MHVAFVCTGNICRSPMAEAVLRDRAPSRSLDLTVTSSGTWAIDGNRATPDAVDVMRRRGVDLSGHRSRSLDVRELRAADLVVAMTSVHLREIGEAAPDAIPKVVLMKELTELEPGPLAPDTAPSERMEALLAARRPPWRRAFDLDDPMGLPIWVYDRCATEIEASVGRLLDLLSPGA